MGLPEKGFLYVMRNPNDEPNCYKIGFSKNPYKRARQHMGSGFKESGRFDILLNYPVVDARRAEKLAFSLLHDFRYNDRKEFFVCDIERIMKVMNAVQRHINLGKPLESTFITDEELDAIQQRDYL